MAKSSKSFENKYILNCDESQNQDDDWNIEDAVDAGLIDGNNDLPDQVDLRNSRWWPVDDQGDTGACVGYATAYGVLRWHYIQAGLLRKRNHPKSKPSARFIWMANKETDKITNFPTTFLESEGTQTKFALKIAQKYGCVTDDILPMSGGLCTLKSRPFYIKAARLRISNYINLRGNLDNWRSWLAENGPILTRLNVDDTWIAAEHNRGKLDVYKPDTKRGGHAVCLVGYNKKGFIVRNSWGEDWGHNGFAYASDRYAKKAFTEAYGAIL